MKDYESTVSHNSMTLTSVITTAANPSLLHLRHFLCIKAVILKDVLFITGIFQTDNSLDASSKLASPEFRTRRQKSCIHHSRKDRMLTLLITVNTNACGELNWCPVRWRNVWVNLSVGIDFTARIMNTDFQFLHSFC